MAPPVAWRSVPAASLAVARSRGRPPEPPGVYQAVMVVLREALQLRGALHASTFSSSSPRNTPRLVWLPPRPYPKRPASLVDGEVSEALRGASGRAPGSLGDED